MFFYVSKQSVTSEIQNSLEAKTAYILLLMKKNVHFACLYFALMKKVEVLESGISVDFDTKANSTSTKIKNVRHSKQFKTNSLKRTI